MDWLLYLFAQQWNIFVRILDIYMHPTQTDLLCSPRFWTNHLKLYISNSSHSIWLSYIYRCYCRLERLKAPSNQSGPLKTRKIFIA